VDVEYVPGEHVVHGDGIRPSVGAYGGQHAVLRPR